MQQKNAILASCECIEPANTSCPERGLLAAILWRAYWDLFSNVESKDRVSAIQWFEGAGDFHQGFSYQDIIDTLDLGNRYIKRINAALENARIYGKHAHEHQFESEGKEGGAFNSKLAKRPGCFIST